MDPVTKSKVYWIKGDKESLRTQLSEFIDPSQLEVKFGGDREKTIEEDLLEKNRQTANMNGGSNTNTERSANEKELKRENSKSSDKAEKHKQHSKSKLKEPKKHSKADLNTSDKKN